VLAKRELSSRSKVIGAETLLQGCIPVRLCALLLDRAILARAGGSADRRARCGGYDRTSHHVFDDVPTPEEAPDRTCDRTADRSRLGPLSRTFGGK
jgi:hypothetical protein